LALELALFGNKGYHLPVSDVRPLSFDNGVPSMSVRFTQPCPTCGRRLQIRASLLGCTVACQHCQAEFVADCGIPVVASSADDASPPVPDPLMLRVEKALEKASQQTALS
jgi:hypothetical protein